MVTLLLAHPRVHDVALAAIALVAGFVLLWHVNDGRITTYVLSLGCIAVAGLALLARRRFPIVVLVMVVAARILVAVETGNEVPLLFAIMVALFTVARSGDRRRSLAIAVAAAVVTMIAVAFVEDEALLPELLGEAAFLGLPIALADGARSRAERLRDVIDTEADRRVSAERLRIARDLHDVVAHGLSTIAIQSGVAAHLIDRDQDQAKRALEIINETGKASLEELRAMVGVLRSTDQAPLRPTPADPDDFSELEQSAKNAGISLTITKEGGFPDNTGDACVVALHRIIQEALTNVARHAGAAPTTVAIAHGEQQVEVTIVNQAGPVAVPAVPSTGVGIIGMTERAESLGGELITTNLQDGGFKVIATIPYHRRHQKVGSLD